MISWYAAIDDADVLTSLAGRTYDFSFMYIRDPVAAIPSIILENRYGIRDIVEWRYACIYAQVGRDIARCQELERAVLSLCYWYDIIERHLRPQLLLRIESELDASNFIKTMISKGYATRSPAVLPKPTNKYKTYKGRVYVKPNIQTHHYLEMSDVVQRSLESFCSRYGYRAPWEREASRQLEGPVTHSAA